MGIVGSTAKFLLHARKGGVDFTNLLMLGRQQIFIDDSEHAVLEARQPGITSTISEIGAFSEPFFYALGSKEIDSLDYSTFEKATVIHDLNTPISDAMRNRYSLVFDGGTLEHVFNYPVAIKNCMDMACVGGHVILVTPANNFCGHGFYQFSPELFFSLFTEQHGFKIEQVLLLAEPEGRAEYWYSVKDPSHFKRRVTFVNDCQTTVLVLARKTRDTSDISLRPMQSDYAHLWAVHNSISDDVAIAGESKLLHFYRTRTPEWIKRIVRTIVGSLKSKEKRVTGLGHVNPDFFERIEL
ncbi:MAG TPA: hypothetical protein VK658_27705 [Chryseolinea sp.]|nr:hypothetical protein [Chryseolinea sp.]